VKKLGQGGSFHHQTDKRKGLYLAMLPSGVIILDYVAKGRDSFLQLLQLIQPIVLLMVKK
jgi:hypothetical protein